MFSKKHLSSTPARHHSRIAFEIKAPRPPPPTSQASDAMPEFAQQHRRKGMVPDTAFAPPALFLVGALPAAAPMRVVHAPQDHRYFVQCMLGKAVSNARPWVANVLIFGDDHANQRSISMIQQLFIGTVELNHILNIGTVQFELPTGSEKNAEFNMHSIAGLVAATPGGINTHLKNIPAPDVEITKIYYLMACAWKMGFRIECIDSPESVTRADSTEHREFHMTRCIRRTTHRGGGVIAIVGTNHVAPLQANLLRGTAVPWGGFVTPPVNAVSLASYGDLSNPAARVDTLRNAAYGLPPSHAEFVRFDTRAANEYSPLPY